MFTQPARHLQSIEAGQHDVEHNCVKRSRHRDGESILSIMREHDVVAFFRQPLIEQRGHAAIVFYYQNPHLTSMLAN